MTSWPYISGSLNTGPSFKCLSVHVFTLHEMMGHQYLSSRMMIVDFKISAEYLLTGPNNHSCIFSFS